MNNEKTVIYLVRHGQSIGNLIKVCLGHTDLELTEKGYIQADMTFNELKNVDFSAVYSSDLVRARETARPHAEYRGLDVCISDKLRELNFGIWENRDIKLVAEEYGELFTVVWRSQFGSFTAPEGEAVVDCADRMVAEVEKIASKHHGETVLIVSHAAAIRALWGKISGLAPELWAKNVPFPTNASYSVLKFDGERLIPGEYSCDAHLGDFVTAVETK